MPVKQTTPPLSDREAESLMNRISKDSGYKVKVRRGKTNGRNVLHVYVPGKGFNGDTENSGVTSLTIQSLAEWYNHPACTEARNARKEAREQAAEADASDDLKVTHKDGS